MRVLIMMGVLSAVAMAAMAAEWRPLPAAADVQSMLDMDSVRTEAGIQQMLIRREYSVLRAGPAMAKGAPYRSERVNYDIDCATRRAAPTLSAYYGDDRKLVASDRHARLPRPRHTVPEAGSDVAEAIQFACERLRSSETAVPPVDAPPYAIARRGDTSGSGIVVSSEGHVLTNQHVVQQCDAHEIIGVDNQPQRATLIAADAWRDLALLKMDRRATSIARVRADAAPRLGEAVTVAGYPLATMLGTQPTVGFGHVSSLVGINDNPAQMQISVPIQRGNSGGPVLDHAGNVIGMVASKLDALKVAESLGDLPQNVNFAIRGEVMRTFLDAQRVAYVSSRESVRLESTELAAQGAAITVRVRCARK